jgi:hypothetical protein
MSNVWERRLALEVRRKHLRIHPVALWGSAVFVIVVVVVGSGVEVGRAFVLVRSTML